ncbi:methyl-accepting chemotaxis protein [Salsuginibacillus halophilus]|uniref:Methyl-accepting chemotaxis protein n=1 Tax=Salsuginibacillus halophilus TaxID=517424 RepID=A0A2P8H8Q8_9BACI|nr:methyl-accepting chemotaxis protein [Salsuginibacillus halophilus]PSL42594.1 methyl-accepting chemotaxis protein [Salsuginibacillus halophilus]
MRWTIRKKLVTGFVGIAVILAAAIGFALTQMNQMSQTFDFLLNEERELQGTVAEIEANVNQQSSRFRAYLLNEEDADLDSVYELNMETGDLIEEAQELAVNPAHEETLEELWSSNISYRSNARGVENLNDSMVDYANRSVIPIGRDMREDTQALLASLDEDVAAATDETLAEAGQTILLVSIISIGAVILAVVAGVLISNRIARPIISLSHAASQMADGDLTAEKQQLKTNDEINDLNEAFETMKANLRGMIGRIATGAQSVAASSEEMKASADETSSATQQITESIQEVAGGADRQTQQTSEAQATSQEINEGMSQIAETVEHVSQSSLHAGENASNGVKVIDDTVEQMESIDAQSEQLVQKVSGLSKQSEQIDEIISMITSIAEQTNLLALNAAIEAARAGEHGKGFAVVADEVRKLAEQSNQSAQEVSSLITQIQEGINESVEMAGGGREAVQSGLKHVGEARQEFTSISSSIQDVTGQIQEVVAAVEEMSAGTDTLNTAVQTTAEEASSTSSYAENVAASAEEQMASMEEVSSAADSLSEMAEDLEEEVQKFKIGQNPAAEAEEPPLEDEGEGEDEEETEAPASEKYTA